MALPVLSALNPRFANDRQRGTDYILRPSGTSSVQFMSVKGFFMGLSESCRKSSCRSHLMQSDILYGETEKSIERREQLFRKYVVIRREAES